MDDVLFDLAGKSLPFHKLKTIILSWPDFRGEVGHSAQVFVMKLFLETGVAGDAEKIDDELEEEPIVEPEAEEEEPKGSGDMEVLPQTSGITVVTIRVLQASSCWAAD